MSERYSRRLSIMSNAADELVYRLWQGEELLLERRGAAETIEAVRRAVEPLRPGMHATLGSGKTNDPTVAVGQVAADTNDPAAAAAAIAINNAAAISNLSVQMAKQAAETFKFTKAIAEEAVAAIRTAGAEERAAFMRHLERQAETSGRPLIDGGQAAQLVSSVGQLIQQFRGDK